MAREPERAWHHSAMTEIPEFAALLEEIVGSQHHGSFSVDWPFEELTRCSLLNRIAQPQKLIYSLICLHLMLAFRIVHRRGADRTPHCLALIKHREINDHPIEVVAQYFASLQRHCKSSVLKRSDYAISAGRAQPAIAASKISEFFEVTQHPTASMATPKQQRRRALELLEASIDGCTEAIMLAYGFKTELLVELVNAGLATASIERIVVGGRRVEVTRVRITGAGRRALAKLRWP
jgi:hypothetical protein